MENTNETNEALEGPPEEIRSTLHGSPVILHEKCELDQEGDGDAALENEPSPKRLKLNEPKLQASGEASSETSSSVPAISPQSSSSTGKEKGSSGSGDWECRMKIKARLKQKQALLGQLKKVEFYKSKWSIDELEILTMKWKELALTTFEDLFQKSQLERESLTKRELINHLGVDPELIDLDLSPESTQEFE